MKAMTGPLSSKRVAKVSTLLIILGTVEKRNLSLDSNKTCNRDARA